MKINIFASLTYETKVQIHGGLMSKEKIVRLQELFEKMVAECANDIERKELKTLYQEYINFGRSKIIKLR